MNLLREMALSQYDELIRGHDWTYEFSDDSGAFNRGDNHVTAIRKQFDLLVREFNEPPTHLISIAYVDIMTNGVEDPLPFLRRVFGPEIVAKWEEAIKK